MKKLLRLMSLLAFPALSFGGSLEPLTNDSLAAKNAASIEAARELSGKRIDGVLNSDNAASPVYAGGEAGPIKPRSASSALQGRPAGVPAPEAHERPSAFKSALGKSSGAFKKGFLWTEFPLKATAGDDLSGIILVAAFLALLAPAAVVGIGAALTEPIMHWTDKK